jgi:branched-chain amino acid transport system ATP-binding protein
LCVLGRNGVGKSTTMKAVMGLVRPSAGTVAWKGKPVQGLAPYRLARLGLGYVPEERRIFPTITVRENLLMGTKRPAHGGVPRWTLERIFEFFPHLAERREQRAGTLSGGEQQMLTIGRTLMGDPDLVMVDEPTEGLAPMIVERVELVLDEVRRAGVAVLLVEQAIETALALASRAYVIAKGATVFAGSVADLQRDASIRKRYLEV